jgi:hypothetical protein
MSENAPDLTPPTKAAKAPKEPKAAKAPKEPKAAKAPKEPKARPVRGSYGLHPQSVISLTAKENTYRGQRADWFSIMKSCDGKTVAEFDEAAKGRVNGKGTPQAPNGWLRFYVLDGTVVLTPPAGLPSASSQTESAAA